MIPAQVDISKAEIPVEHDQKSTLTVVLHFSIDRTDEKTQTIYLKSCCTPKMNVRCQLYLNKKYILKRKVSNTKHYFKIKYVWDFTTCPVVEAQQFKFRRHSFHPWLDPDDAW